MSRTITGTITSMVTLVAGDDPVLVAPSAYIHDATLGIYGAYGTAWNITNQGTVVGTNAAGIVLLAGGSVGNEGTIRGGAYALYVAGAAGTVTNTGLIGGLGTEAGAVGIQFNAGGTIANTATDATIYGLSFGAFVDGGLGTITNAGSIGGNVGVFLRQGGSVANQGTAGVIDGDVAAVSIEGDVGTVTNEGTVAAGTLGAGVLLNMGGSVQNGASGATAASIYGGMTGVEVAGATGTVVNYGTIASGTGVGGGYVGVLLEQGGSVTNAAGATITGYDAGILAPNLAVTVANAGSISAAGGDGVLLGVGGLVTNAAGGAIYGGERGVAAADGAATVVNDGIIRAGSSLGIAGVSLQGGGSVTNNAGATISGYAYGILVTGAEGTVTNAGLIGGYGTDVAMTGIGLTAGGTVANTSVSGTILGALAGIVVNYGTGTVINAGTIGAESLTGMGIILRQGGSVENQVTDGTLGVINGYLIGAGIYGAGTVTNQGTIAGTAGVGVFITGGGTVTNGASGNTAAGIYGASFGVYITGASGTVTNYGVIASGACGCSTYDGIQLQFGGTVTNAEGGLILGYRSGIYAGLAAATVANSGYISAAYGAGVLLGSGGTVTNGAAGFIYGGISGLDISGAASVVNEGTIRSGTIFGLSYEAVRLRDGGSVSNAASGTITGYQDGVHIHGGEGTVTNAGTIQGLNQTGVRLGDGGTVGNSASIYGKVTGVAILGTVGTVANDGSIATALTYGAAEGIYLAFGGSVTNASSAVVTGFQAGVYARYGAATVSNSGTITAPLSGSGVRLGAGGTVINDAGAAIYGNGFGVSILGATGTVDNSGSIGTAPAPGAFDAILLDAGGSVTNAASGTVSGYSAGVRVANATGSVTNAGLIEASGGNGVQLGSGGTLLNETTGTIRGRYFGVYMAGAGTVTNYGSIGTGSDPSAFDGVNLTAGGSVSNAATGTISGYDSGITVRGAEGNVVNSGLVQGDGIAGVVLYEGGSVTNQAGATILGVSGVQMTASGGTGSTLVNAGTITATGPLNEAVGFQQPDSRLVIVPGAVFNGLVVARGANSTIELADAASEGTLSGLGTDFIDFAAIEVAAGAEWTLSGTNTIGFGTTFTLGIGADLDVTGTLSGGAAFVLSAAVLRLVQEVDAGDSFDFGDAGADTVTLDAVAGDSFTNAIIDFGTLDTIVLPGVSFVVDSTPILGVNTLTVDLVGGGTFTFGNFAMEAGAPTTFLIGEHSVQAVLCFLGGTRIATPGGERAVQHLSPGDSVLTVDGAVEPIVWIGRGKVLVTPGRRTAATPVIVRKGALAANVPYRDLRVTKGHSLWIDGALIPVEFLINHRSIAWDDHAREVEIFHIELATHGVLLADGAPAESYRDDGNRWLFDHENPGWSLPPQPPCAPVLTGGPVVDAAWARLLHRAGPRPGLPLTDDPDLHLLADGVRIDPCAGSHGVLVFQLDTAPAHLRIVSRSGVPAELGLGRDGRPLGVALWRMVIANQRLIEAGDPDLTEGFHDFEPIDGWRWTNGDAALPSALFAGLRGRIEFELHIGCTARYLLEGAVGHAA